MSLFLTRDHNLADLKDLNEARKNLGFGNIVYSDSNNVNITGGSVRIDTLSFNQTNESLTDKYLKCGTNGIVEFSELSQLGEWAEGVRDPKTINLTNFSFDGFVFSEGNTVADVCETGSYQDLVDTPTNLGYFQNDLNLLQISSNLSDLRNVEEARVNLGLGDVALWNSNDTINLNTLNISGNLFLRNQQHMGDDTIYLHAGLSGKIEPKPLIHASISQFGVVRITDNLSTETGLDYVPTANSVREKFDDMEKLIEGDVSLSREIDKFILDKKLMKNDENLSKIDNKQTARLNIGLGHLEELVTRLNDTGQLDIDTLVINSNMSILYSAEIDNSDPKKRDRDRFLVVNPQTKQIDALHLQLAKQNQFGVVKVITNPSFFSTTNEVNESTTMSVGCFSNFVSTVVTRRLDSISNSIEPKIHQMYKPYMKISGNLNVDEPSIARGHLCLHDVAFTGSYYSLCNYPRKLSSFENTPIFLTKSNCFSEFTVQDKLNARHNLNIGDIALLDSNDMQNLKGTAGCFEDLIVTDTLTYNPTNQLTIDKTNKYLFSYNDNGDCEWSDLPVASRTRKGIVRVINSIEGIHSSDDTASSSSALFKVYHRLMGQISELTADITKINKLLP
jgi:hypothetical protein